MAGASARRQTGIVPPATAVKHRPRLPAQLGRAELFVPPQWNAWQPSLFSFGLGLPIHHLHPQPDLDLSPENLRALEWSLPTSTTTTTTTTSAICTSPWASTSTTRWLSIRSTRTTPQFSRSAPSCSATRCATGRELGRRPRRLLLAARDTRVRSTIKSGVKHDSSVCRGDIQQGLASLAALDRYAPPPRLPALPPNQHVMFPEPIPLLPIPLAPILLDKKTPTTQTRKTKTIKTKQDLRDPDPRDPASSIPQSHLFPGEDDEFADHDSEDHYSPRPASMDHSPKPDEEEPLAHDDDMVLALASPPLLYNESSDDATLLDSESADDSSCSMELEEDETSNRQHASADTSFLVEQHSLRRASVTSDVTTLCPSQGGHFPRD